MIPSGDSPFIGLSATLRHTIAGTLLLSMLMILLPTPSARVGANKHSAMQPNTLTLLSTIGESGTFAVDQRNNVLTLGVHDTLHVFDVTHPAQPIERSTIKLGGLITDISLADDFAVVAMGWNGTKIIDLSNLQSPKQISYIQNEPKKSSLVRTVQDLVFIVGDRIGIYNITDRTNPQLLGSLFTSELAYYDPTDMTISGDLLFIVRNGDGPLIVDISDLSHPFVIADVQWPSGTPEYSFSLSISNSRLYLTAQTKGLWIYDINNIRAPTLLGNIKLSGGAYDVVVKGDYAYVSTFLLGSDQRSGLAIVNVEDPRHPVVVSFLDSPYDPGNSFPISVDGDYAYLAGRAFGLVIMNISDKKAPTIVASEIYIGDAYTLARYENLVAVGQLNNWVMLVDITVPSSPVEVGRIAVSGYVFGVALRSGLLAISGPQGTYLVDISSPSQPRLLTLIQATTESRALMFLGSTLYIAHQHGLTLVNTSDSSRPSTISTLNWNYIGAEDFRSMGKLQLIATGDGLLVVDSGDESRPRLVSRYSTTPPWIGGVSFVNNTVLLAAKRDFQIVDLTIPASPKYISTITYVDGARKVAADNSAIFVTDGTGQLNLIDISDVEHPATNRVTNLENFVGQISLSSNVLLTANGVFGLRIFSYTGTPAPNASPTSAPTAVPSSTPLVLTATPRSQGHKSLLPRIERAFRVRRF